ncbi:SH3 domain-containing protein [Rhizobium pusense]|uniref:SH3 domain-containing protein n=1 Tax=Agrobacterium pusense TaxID=648995 RepID=UPI0024468888|nr:SH3 domain-containing protein [Agrobacterium pusense]MDH1270761.1 SH3 domain-containing protein [Agrobacterium pusense]
MQKRYWLLCGMILLGIMKLGETPEGGRGVAHPSSTAIVPSAPAKLVPDPPPKPLPQSTPAERATPVAPAQDIERAEPKYVRGNSVAFRQAPNAKANILDRLNIGKRVMVLAHEGQWSRVKDDLTQREGWVASRFLSDDEPVAKQEAPEVKQTVEVKPKISPSIIIQRIIAESIAGYPGTCACPYSTDRRGRKCGNRSAYSKPGGYAPICFAGDVTRSMIEAYN